MSDWYWLQSKRDGHLRGLAAGDAAIFEARPDQKDPEGKLFWVTETSVSEGKGPQLQVDERAADLSDYGFEVVSEGPADPMFRMDEPMPSSEATAYYQLSVESIVWLTSNLERQKETRKKLANAIIQAMYAMSGEPTPGIVFAGADERNTIEIAEEGQRGYPDYLDPTEERGPETSGYLGPGKEEMFAMLVALNRQMKTEIPKILDLNDPKYGFGDIVIFTRKSDDTTKAGTTIALPRHYRSLLGVAEELGMDCDEVVQQATRFGFLDEPSRVEVPEFEETNSPDLYF